MDRIVTGVICRLINCQSFSLVYSQLLTGVVRMNIKKTSADPATEVSLFLVYQHHM